MRLRFLFAAALALLPAAALAQSNAGGGGGGGGGGGSSGPYYPGQYNATLPAFANGQVGYLQLDSNGRLILSPGSTMTVTGTVAVTQSTSPWVVSNGGTFAVQNTAAVIGGNTTAVKTDGSATTQPVSAATLPLPTGASTAANQATANTSLAAIQQRAVTFTEAAGASVAANGGVSTGASRDVGATPLYTKFNAVVSSNQTGTLSLQGSNDNFATTVSIGSMSVTSGVPAYITAPVMFRYNREVFTNTNTTTAATVSINTSYTAN